ncbi:MAG: hypothetical protein ACRD3H_11650 [Terriglobales bacterium]
MVARVEYDSGVERLNSATVAGLALALLALIFLPASLAAQINGTPASVTSPGFGGHFNQGVPASVTSMGPNGLQPRNQIFATPNCCINPLFPVNPNPPLFPRNHHRRRQGSFFPAGGAVYVPYPVPVEPDVADSAMDPNQAQEREQDDYRGGPTIFDRRGPGRPAPYLDDYPQRVTRTRSETEVSPVAAPAESPVADQPQTVLVYKDGHQVEVQNYAVVGNMLYDLTPGHHRKIAIADLDLKATAKQNDDLGINFQLPAPPETNK